MGMLDFFRHRPVPSATLVRERLRIVVGQARSNKSARDYLDAMRSGLTATIKKYTSINDNDADDDFDGSLVTPPNPSPRSIGGASASVKPAQPAH